MRLIGAGGKQVGVLKLSQALVKAKKEGLDLVEIAPNAKPPVVKIVELGKFKYQQEKRARKEKAKSKATELKEVRLSPFIAQHDFANRLERIMGFLADKHKVRTVVVFKGRQLGSKKFGYNLLDRVLDEVGRDAVAVDMEPKFIGRHLAMVISPLIGKKTNAKTKDQKVSNKKV